VSWKTLVIGLASGVLAGLLGVGGGIITVFALVTFLGYSQHQAHVTSLATIPPVTLVAAAIFGSAGEVDLRAAALLTLGALAGTVIGAHYMMKINPIVLRRLLGLMTLAVAIRLLFW